MRSTLRLACATLEVLSAHRPRQRAASGNMVLAPYRPTDLPTYRSRIAPLCAYLLQQALPLLPLRREGAKLLALLALWPKSCLEVGLRLGHLRRGEIAAAAFAKIKTHDQQHARRECGFRGSRSGARAASMWTLGPVGMLE